MSRKRARSLRVIAAAAVLTGGLSTQANAFNPCMSPITYLMICCPKPCQINDPKALAEHSIQKVLEDMKLTSLFKEAMAWKDQLSQWGETLSAINGLVNMLLGAKGGALSAFTPANLVPNGLTSNPNNIGQTAGQVAQFFSQPAPTVAEGRDDSQRRSAVASSGYLEGLAAGIDGRTKLDATGEELKKLTEVVSSASGSGSGSRGEDDFNVHTDLAAMNRTRLAMLQALQNRTNVTSAWNSTESYEALKTMGVDRNAAASSWGTKTAPASAYGSAESNAEKVAASGYDSSSLEMQKSYESSQAFLNYDNVVERAVQIHNAAVAYVSMMGTVKLNQETIAHYELSRNLAEQQRAAITEGLKLFYFDADGAFRQMALEAVGPTGLGSGLDPYTWADSAVQQMAATQAQENLTQKVQTSPQTYGATACEDVPEIIDGEQKLIARFKMPPPLNAAAAILNIYSNPEKLTCGVLLAQWVSQGAHRVYDTYTAEDLAQDKAPDRDRTTIKDADAQYKALQDYLAEYPTAGMDPSFKYWINLQKRSLWYYDFACGATNANDPRDSGNCEIYNRKSNPNARAGGAQGVINNTYRAIEDMQATLNDKTKTVVLQQLPNLSAVTITNKASVDSQLKTLLASAESWRSQVDSKYLTQSGTKTRDKQLQHAIQAIKKDPNFRDWVTTTPASSSDNTCGKNCWGLNDPTWNDPATVMGYPVGDKAPSDPLPVVRDNVNCKNPDASAPGTTAADISRYCQPVPKTGTPWPIRPQTEFYPTSLVEPPFSAGI